MNTSASHPVLRQISSAACGSQSTAPRLRHPKFEKYCALGLLLHRLHVSTRRLAKEHIFPARADIFVPFRSLAVHCFILSTTCCYLQSTRRPENSCRNSGFSPTHLKTLASCHLWLNSLGILPLARPSTYLQRRLAASFHRTSASRPVLLVTLQPHVGHLPTVNELYLCFSPPSKSTPGHTLFAMIWRNLLIEATVCSPSRFISVIWRRNYIRILAIHIHGDPDLLLLTTFVSQFCIKPPRYNIKLHAWNVLGKVRNYMPTMPTRNDLAWQQTTSTNMHPLHVPDPVWNDNHLANVLMTFSAATLQNESQAHDFFSYSDTEVRLFWNRTRSYSLNNTMHSYIPESSSRLLNLTFFLSSRPIDATTTIHFQYADVSTTTKKET